MDETRRTGSTKDAKYLALFHAEMACLTGDTMIHSRMTHLEVVIASLNDDRMSEGEFPALAMEACLYYSQAQIDLVRITECSDRDEHIRKARTFYERACKIAGVADIQPRLRELIEIEERLLRIDQSTEPAIA